MKKSVVNKIRRAIDDPGEYRRSKDEVQTTFWARFGVTQSGGSRYESGREMPAGVRLLLAAYIAEVVDDQLLAELRRAVGGFM